MKKHNPDDDQRACMHARIHMEKANAAPPKQPPVFTAGGHAVSAVIDQIATAARVPYFKIEWALRTLKVAPELFARVERGEISLRMARNKYQRPRQFKAPRKTSPKKTPAPTWNGESELQFLDRILRQMTTVLEEVQVVGGTRWNPDNTNKFALARGLHDAATEVAARFNGLQAKLNPKRGPSVKRREAVTPPKPGGKEDHHESTNASTRHAQDQKTKLEAGTAG